MTLNVKAIRETEPRSKPYKLSDGGGLHLLVSPSGSKLWRFSYRHGGKQKTISMGAFPEVSLKQARDRLHDARRLLSAGTDPSEIRKLLGGDMGFSEAVKRLNEGRLGELRSDRAKQAGGTFGEVTEKWLERSRPTWSDATYSQNLSRLRNDILPHMKDRPVSELAAPDLLAVANRVVDRGAVETARRIVRIMRQVLQYAVLVGKLQYNPANGLVEALPSVKTKHMAAITEPEAVGGLLRAIEGYAGEPSTRSALQLAPLVFVRPGELRQAHWAEIDLDRAVWEIPAERTKMGEPLIVPLSRQALEILEELQPITGNGDLVFPSTRSRTRPISDNTLNAAMRRMGYTKEEMTAHGFRAMARTLLDEALGFRYDLIEQQLGHKVSDPNGRAYNRTKHLPERAKMMQAWADYLDRLKGGDTKVTELRAHG